MTWGKSVLLTIPLVLSGIFAVASPAAATTTITTYSTIGTDWTAVSVGGAHECAIRTGKLYCWGSDDSGQLGNGGDGDQSTPDHIGSKTNWTAVSAGAAHTCGIAGGKLYCWGSNSNGQVGNGFNPDDTRQDAPVQLGTASWTAVSAGGEHTCAIRSDGILLCWGDDSSGQLGNGSSLDGKTTPWPVSAAHWKSISAGGAHTCGVRTDGLIACWGDDSSGQVGNGSKGSPSVPAQISGGTWKTVSAGGSHTCAIRSDNVLACWGSNSSGQVGNGKSINQLAPAQITGSKDWKTVTAGAAHSCGIRGTGALYCWGDGSRMQINDGSTASTSTPTRLYPTTANWKTADAGGSQTCGIRGAGTLYCWGGYVPPKTYPPPGSKVPGELTGVWSPSEWKLNTPVDTNADGVADEIKYGGTPDLATFSDNKYFHSNQTNTGIYFRARADGATTSGSSYPRSELREMKPGGSTNAGWSSNGSHVNTMTITQQITVLPANKDQVVAGQIHDANDDVLEIRLEGDHLFAYYSNFPSGSSTKQTLDSSYTLGEPMNLVIRADSGGVTVTYNGTPHTLSGLTTSANDWYFKAGCYTQTNLSHDAADEYGEVLITSLDMTHT